MLDNKIKAQLQASLPRSAVRERTQAGTTLSYIDGYYTFDTLNEIFGNGGWGYEIKELTCAHEGVDDKSRARCAYRAVVRLTVEGALPIEDVGFGSGIDRDPGAVHEKACKEAVTDAVKRCARALGRVLGLALYDKTQEHVSDGVDEMIAQIEAVGTTAEFATVRGAATQLYAKLDADGQARIKKAMQLANRRLETGT